MNNNTIDSDIVNEMRKEAIKASLRAYSPYSSVQVGASVLNDKGELYTGQNIENSSYGGTVCAERVAIFKLVGESRSTYIKAIYIYSEAGFPPCGLCRQVLTEFGDNKTWVIFGDGKGAERRHTLGEVMPYQFTPDYLGKS